MYPGGKITEKIIIDYIILKVLVENTQFKKKVIHFYGLRLLLQGGNFFFMFTKGA